MEEEEDGGKLLYEKIIPSTLKRRARNPGACKGGKEGGREGGREG